MIYPQTPSAGGSVGKRAGKGSSLAERGKGGGKGGGKPQQALVQWKQKNVEEGIVVVDEQQLSKLIKREPIEKYYKLDPEPFATGLFASVRRCVSLETGEPFAAKFSSRARYGEDCSAEIHHEIALLSLCAPSPRIVKLHDVFETPTEVIILMQFAPGGDLQTVIDDNQVPFETDVVNFVRQLVEGLAYLHERKIAHLDIKPQNLVMMGDFPNCDIKLCDFEISRVILEGTEIREILGTPDYVAPEILHYEPITLAADLWSVGVTTYVLLTGFSPFGGETDQETFCNISRAQLDFPEELFEDVSQEAKDFVQQLLVRDPSARPTARNLLRHRWLSHQNAPRRRNGSADNTKVSVSDTNGRSHTMSEKNLRRYLSKSREALFERVIQQQHQRRQDLRKTTLLSQCDKTRMCESHTSLVSRTREERPLIGLSPSFSRSREKLYGLRSLSRSHEGLDLLRLSGRRGEGASRAYARATTADLGMLPLLRLKENLDEADAPMPSDADGGASENGEPQTNDQVAKDKPQPTCDACPTSVTGEKLLPKDKKFRKINSDSCLQISSLVSPTLLKNTLVNCAKLANTSLPEDGCTVEKTISQNGTATNHDSKSKESKPETLVGHIEPLKLENGENKIETSIDSDTHTIQNGIKEHIDQIKRETASVGPPTEDEETAKDEEEAATRRHSTAEAQPTPDAADPTGHEETEDEPTFTVAQLISAYNRHQEIVTRTSLEVTMTSGDKTSKLPPPFIAEDSSARFPTGPTALRLFIPDIDIETTKRKKNRTKSYRTLSKSSLDRHAAGEAVRAASDATAHLDQTDNHTDTFVCSFVLDPPTDDRNPGKPSPRETDANFLRSASLSSETSSGLTPSEALSSLSWEEVNVVPRTEDTRWSNGANPWGRLCTGSYTRAMEKFGGKNETATQTDAATRKCSLSMLFPVKPERDEKVRRKSTSIIKLS